MRFSVQGLLTGNLIYFYVAYFIRIPKTGKVGKLNVYSYKLLFTVVPEI